jgi:Uma2 family endonuclease
MVSQIHQRQTAEDLERLQGLPENREKWFELVNGVIYEVIMPSSIHAFVANLIAFFLTRFVLEHDLGYVFTDGCVYKLSNGDELIPDASFVAKERGKPSFAAKLELAPDLAVEVISPGNTERQMLDKVESYLQCGTKLVWVVYPGARVVDVFTPNPDGSMTLRKVEANGTLEGGDVLPGFTLQVSEIFANLPSGS